MNHIVEGDDPVVYPRHGLFLSRAGRYLPAGRHLSVLIAIVGVVLTFVFWGCLRFAEQSNVNRLTNLAARVIAAHIVEDILARTNALRRMSKVWELQNPPSVSEWNAFAKMFIQHHPGCLLVEHADSTYRVREVASVGADNDQSELGLDLTLDPFLHSALDASLSRREPILTQVVDSSSGRKVQRIVVPVFHRDQFRGFVLAKVDVDAAMEENLKAFSGLGYSIGILENGRQLYLQPGADHKLSSAWVQSTELHLPGMNWTIQMWPTPQLLSQLLTRLPELALGLPLTLAGLLLIMLHFVQVTSSHARQMESTNSQLNAALRIRDLARDDLSESQARFALVSEISADAIIATNEEQLITLFNQGAEVTLGCKSEEAMGQSLELLLPPRFQTAHRGHAHELSQDQQHRRKMMAARSVGLRKDGTEFPLEASISKLVLKGQTIYTAILRDVTERQSAEDELRRAHNELEVRVQERTLELECANRALQSEIAERKEAEEMLRQLSGRLLQIQDEERRRVARELHDSTAQYLCGLSLNIATVQVGAPELPEHLLAILSDSTLLVDRCSTEIRSLSYLLHPPLLDDLGLTSALQWYAGGFTKRSGVDVQLEFSPELGRLPADHERAYFRIVQECLTNVRRHSGATVARIRLTRDEQGTRLEVTDNGCGMPGLTQATNDVIAHLGVGIAGMRERVRQLGGQIEISSTSKGSVVVATLLMPPETLSSGVAA